MMKKLKNWLLNGINLEHTITKERGNLREAVLTLKEVGIEIEQRRRFIEKYNTRAFIRELTSIGNPTIFSQGSRGFRKPKDNYMFICELAEANRMAKTYGIYPERFSRENCYKFF